MDPVFLRQIATYHARRLGLSGPDAEDCASLFVLRFLEKQPDGDLSNTGRRVTTVPRHSAAWWHLCAKNHALNYRRGLTRYQRHLDPWCDDLDETDGAVSTCGTEGSALGSCLRREAWEAVSLVLGQLSDRTRYLFVAHHLDGMSLDFLAQEQGMQRNAVAQTLFRARASLRRHLEQHGWTQGEFVAALIGEC